MGGNGEKEGKGQVGHGSFSERGVANELACSEHTGTGTRQKPSVSCAMHHQTVPRRACDGVK